MKGGEGVLDVLLKVAKADAEPADRLPATVEELKESKSGLVTFLLLSGRDKEDITKELKAAFKLTGGQAAKIVRRITAGCGSSSGWLNSWPPSRSPAPPSQPRGKPGGRFASSNGRENRGEIRREPGSRRVGRGQPGVD